MSRLDLNVGLSTSWLKKGTESLKNADGAKTEDFDLDVMEAYHTVRYINYDFTKAGGQGNIVWPIGTDLAAGSWISPLLLRSNANPPSAYMLQYCARCMMYQLCLVSRPN